MTNGALPVVLLVDDSATLRSIVKVHLLGSGVRFLEAGTAEQALALCNTEPVELLILDLHLPGMSGLELTKALRSGAIPKMQKVPVILLTGDPSQEGEQAATAAGVQAFVRKPVNRSKLSEAVNRLLGR